MHNVNYSLDLPKLEDLIEPSPLTISPQKSVIKAIFRMNEGKKQQASNSNYVLVVDKSILVGILTEKAIIRLIAEGIDLAQVRVGEVMSSEIITLKKEDFRDIFHLISIFRLHQIRYLPVVDNEEQLSGIICWDTINNFINIPQLYEVSKSLKEELERLEKKLITSEAKIQAIGDGVITTDALGIVQSLNLIAERLTGWQTREAKGHSVNEVFKLVHESTREEIASPVLQVIQGNQEKNQEDKDSLLLNNSILIARNQREYTLETSAAPIHDRTGKIISVVMVFRDVTKVRKLVHKLSWQAIHDSLTGLYNGRSFEEKLAEAISKSSNDQSNVLCYLDLDQFKIVNDTCGHTAGDELLRQVTTLLSPRIRDSDIFARLRGDKFGLILHLCSLAMANAIVNELLELIKNFRFTWKGKVFKIGISLG